MLGSDYWNFVTLSSSLGFLDSLGCDREFRDCDFKIL